MIENLEIGAFYWIQVALDPDTDTEWENQPMPARYEGGEKWTYLGVEGISVWPVRWVGDKIIPRENDGTGSVEDEAKKLAKTIAGSACACCDLDVETIAGAITTIAMKHADGIPS